MGSPRPGTASSGPSLPGGYRLEVCSLRKGDRVFFRLLDDPLYLGMHFVDRRFLLCDGEDRCGHHELPYICKAYCSAVRWSHPQQDWFRTVAELTENAWIQLVFQHWRGHVVELQRQQKDKRGRVDVTFVELESLVNLPTADNIVPTLCTLFGRKHLPTINRPRATNIVYVAPLEEKLPPPPRRPGRPVETKELVDDATRAAFQAARKRLSSEPSPADMPLETLANTVGAKIVSIEAARMERDSVKRSRALKGKKNAKTS